MKSPSHPAAHDLPAGTHALCTCGGSKNGPFCDGSHLSITGKGSGRTPHILKLDEPRTLYLCNCGASGNAPFCDGSHAKPSGSTESPSGASPAPRPWWKFWG